MSQEEAKTTRYEAGTVLFEEGTSADRVFIVNSGSIRLTRRVFREDLLIEVLGRGHVCGEVALIEGATYATTAIADEDCEVVVVARKRVAETLLSSPRIVERMMARMVTRVGTSAFRLANLALRDPLARVMVQLRHEAERDGALDGALFASIPYDLPETLGLEKGTVDRALRQLGADGLVELDGAGRFRLNDPAAFDRRLSYLELKDRIED